MNYKHGYSGTPEYAAWRGIHHRTTNPKHPKYKHYGARGITMCPDIRDSFMAFLKAVGPRPSAQHSIDRIDNDGSYCVGNMRWACPDQQQRNTRHSKMLTFQGRTQSMAAWAEETGIPYHRLRSRLNIGWPVEQALAA